MIPEVIFHVVYLPIERCPVPSSVPLLIFWLLLLTVKTNVVDVLEYHLKFEWVFGHTLYMTPI